MDFEVPEVDIEVDLDIDLDLEMDEDAEEEEEEAEEEAEEEEEEEEEDEEKKKKKKSTDKSANKKSTDSGSSGGGDKANTGSSGGGDKAKTDKAPKKKKTKEADKVAKPKGGKVKGEVKLKKYQENQLAQELGFDVPQVHFDHESGNLLKQFIVDSTPFRVDKKAAEAAKEKDKAEGGDGEDVAITVTTAKPAQIKHRNNVAAARFKRIESVDKAAKKLQPIGRVQAAHWIEKVLLEGEVELMQLPTIGFFGMPGAPSKLTKGYGMLLLTKLDGMHRLHYLSQSEHNEVSSHEKWSYDNVTSFAGDEVTDSETTIMIDTETTAMRANLVMTANLNIDGNLFHRHGSLEDRAQIVEQLKGGYEHTVECCDCCSCCGDCCKSCCKCLAFCFTCKCFGFCQCCKTVEANEHGHWSASGDYNVIAETSFVNEYTDDNY